MYARQADFFIGFNQITIHRCPVDMKCKRGIQSLLIKKVIIRFQQTDFLSILVEQPLVSSVITRKMWWVWLSQLTTDRLCLDPETNPSNCGILLESVNTQFRFVKPTQWLCAVWKKILGLHWRILNWLIYGLISFVTVDCEGYLFNFYRFKILIQSTHKTQDEIFTEV